MKTEQVDEVLNQYTMLIELAEAYVKEKYPHHYNEIRIANGTIEEYTNTACNCHPEYNWVELVSLAEFKEWVAKRNP